MQLTTELSSATYATPCVHLQLHIDTSAWTKSTFAGPGKLEGEESLGSRALWRFVSAGYGRSQGKNKEQKGRNAVHLSQLPALKGEFYLLAGSSKPSSLAKPKLREG
eukprot:147301-Pelagomonas_calceolata.AAC.1